MEIEKLKQFIELAKEEGVTSLTYETDDEKYKVEFGQSKVPQYVNSAQSGGAPSDQTTSALNQSLPSNSADQYQIVSSPFVGTFYASPAPGKPNYVKVGDRVSKGQVLCILEAMKIMNEIESEVDGEVVEICVENESLVEFGQEIFKIKG